MRCARRLHRRGGLGHDGGALSAHASGSPEKRTVKDAGERPSLPVHIDLFHDEAVLRAVAETWLE